MSSDTNQGKCKDKPKVTFLPAEGSIIGGIAKEKTARITDAMVDLQLGIDGLRSRMTDVGRDGRWIRSLESFARTCSVFLRKTVLGDRGLRETRLLDDSILELVEFQFAQLRSISQDQRREFEIRHAITDGMLQLTKLDDHTLEPEATFCFPAGPQELKLTIEWPLPGVADWTGVPSEDAPWTVSPNQLFQTDSGPALRCDDWLGQQVVLFDGNGISLKEIIRTVVNFEGAHSIDVGRLSQVEGEEISRAARNPAPHILNAITICGFRYAHLVVIECALYLYDKLLDVSLIERPQGEIYMVTPAVACAPEPEDSTFPDWLRFQGTKMISFSGLPTLIQHKIKAVS